jgi:glycosyltransferase involved in cell wall biosynthesis
MDYSFVVPALNEAESLPELFREIAAAAQPRSDAWEVVVVDDGNTDATADVVRQAARSDPRVRLIQFNRN